MRPPRLGLLACDRLWEPLRSAHGDYAEMYSALLRAAGAEFELVSWAVYAGELPASSEACDAWLVSGSRASAFEDRPWIAPLLEFVRATHATGVRQVGICFGHQVLAHALGGRVERAAGGWGLGNIELTLRDRAGVPSNVPDRPQLFMAHQDQVVKLPPGAMWLAEAPHCPHAMFALGGSTLGIQPHPEFSAAFMRDMTLDQSLNLPEPLRAQALASYAAPVDSLVVGRWIAQFLGLQRA
ncbi:MAG: type 1 glutamine amidotransferase [Gammaproteobacteria bacterium]|nr:type 1 glutamine amidotransferase [Gammaproteobacteria bacterium]